MQDRTREPPPPGPKVADSTAIPPAFSLSIPSILVAVFCATLSAVLVIAVFDMLSPGPAPATHERAPSWPER